MHPVRTFTALCALALTLAAGPVLAGDTARAASLVATSPTVTGEPAAIYKIDTREKVLALTFDISWGERAPGPILDILKQKNVTKATFFLSGPWVLHHQEIAKRIKNMGYEIGSHGNMHQNFSEHTNTWIREQVAKAERSIQDSIGVKTTLIRTPNGDFDKRSLAALHRMGYTVIQWNTDSLDWMNPGVERIQQRVLTRVTPGDIILMHASDSCKQTHLALPTIIDGLRAKGYTFLTVSELINSAKGKSVPQ